MLREKSKDPKSKEKLDILKSAQNLSYILSPFNQEAFDTLRTVVSNHAIQPIQTVYDKQFDKKHQQYFLKTKHNQLKANSQYLPYYRSPFSNQYYPSVDEKQGIYPSPLIRNIEQKGHILFSEYAKMYYGPQNCIANFFVEENEEDFCFAFYVQKTFTDGEEGFSGIWSSTNMAEIKGDPSKNINYKVNTSVIYQLKYIDENKNETSFSGNIKKIKNDNKRPQTDTEIDEFHLMMIGKMVQENETFLRQQIESVFMRKTREVVDKTRIPQSNAELEERKKFNRALFESHPLNKNL